MLRPRAVALAALTLAAALAVPASAQSDAVADAHAVADALAGLPHGSLPEAVLVMLGGGDLVLLPPDVRAPLAARLAADVPPEALAEAARFAGGDAFGRVRPALAGAWHIARLGEAEGQPVPDGPAARLAARLGGAPLVLALVEGTIRQGMATSERFRAGINDETGPDAMVEMLAVPIGEAMPALLAGALTAALADVPAADVEATDAFAASSAGQAVLGALTATVAALGVPALIETLDAATADDDGEGTYELVQEPPVLLGGIEGLQAQVVYPDAARMANVEGRVVVQFVVDERGEVVDPVVVRSPDDRLSEAALAAVRSARFTPGRQDGRPVKVRFTLPIDFRLR